MIWIDSNEDVMSTIPFSLKRLGLPIVISSIKVGDYIVEANKNSICVERKEVGDYFQSKQSGHLDTQLYNMSSSFSLSFLVIIGNIQAYLISNNIPRQTFYASYIGSSLKVSPDGKQGQIVVNECPTDEDFVMWLKTLHSKVEEGNFTRLPRLMQSKASPNDIALNVLCSFPNIGLVRAKEILKTHKTLGNVFMVLTCANDLGVKGVSTKTLSEMKKILSTEYGEQV